MFGTSPFAAGAFGSPGTPEGDDVNITVPIAGWGSSTWSTGAWGTNVTLPQGTTAVGTVSVAINNFTFWWSMYWNVN